MAHYLKIENDLKLRNNFGFVANSALPIWDNVRLVFEKMSTKEYFNKINTTSFHDLCATMRSPNGVGALLGLGIKFCIKCPYPNKNSLSDAFERFRRDIRLRYFFAGNNELGPKFNPKLYIKYEWPPPFASSNIENRINELYNLLTSTCHNIIRNTHPSSNLSKHQHHLMNWLNKNPDFIVLNCDKI